MEDKTGGALIHLALVPVRLLAKQQAKQYITVNKERA
jgi:hypothetical protein